MISMINFIYPLEPGSTKPLKISQVSAWLLDLLCTLVHPHADFVPAILNGVIFRLVLQTIYCCKVSSVCGLVSQSHTDLLY